MLAYVAGRVAQSAVAVLGVSLLVFGIVRLSGDPTLLLLGLEARPEQHAALREQLGLNDPLHVQYVRFVTSALHGDLGRSIRWEEPAGPLVLQHLPATVELAVAAIVLAVLIGVPLGAAGAIRRGSLADRLALAASVLGQSMPGFWLGMMLVLVFAVGLRLLPVGGRGGPEHLILPSVTLAIYFAASISRLTRAAMLTSLSSDYVRFARIKGVSLRDVVFRHALRNAAIPVISLVALDFATLLGGAVIVETIFAWPGVGWLAVEAIYARDYPVVQAVTILTSLVFVFVNLGTDLLYIVLDPRIRLARSDARAG